MADSPATWVDLPQQELFRRAFLVTFRTFATAKQVFDLLLTNYELQQPEGLSTSEAGEWKQKRLRPMQKRVLDVLTMWLEDYDLLNQDPDIPPALDGFLKSIQNPSSLSLTAKHILISLERLVRVHKPALSHTMLTTFFFSDFRRPRCLSTCHCDIFTA